MRLNEEIRHDAYDWKGKWANLSMEETHKIIEVGLKISRGQEEWDRRDTIYALGNIADCLKYDGQIDESCKKFMAGMLDRILGRV